MKIKEINQKVDEGYLHVNLMFEVVGTPKEYVEKSLKLYIEKLKSDESIIILEELIEGAELQEGQDNLWSAIGETEVLVKGMEKLTWIAFNFMPASIEIMAPESITFKARELTSWLNDLLAKNHQIALLSQQVGQQNKMMLQNVNTLLRNTILILIDGGVVLKKDIAGKIGISLKDIVPVFEAMEKEGTIKKEGNKYLRP